MALVNGCPKLMDFGVTSALGILPSPGAVPPEGAAPSIAGDIYAFGVLFEALLDCVSTLEDARVKRLRQLARKAHSERVSSRPENARVLLRAIDDTVARASAPLTRATERRAAPPVARGRAMPDIRIPAPPSRASSAPARPGPPPLPGAPRTVRGAGDLDFDVGAEPDEATRSPGDQEDLWSVDDEDWSPASGQAPLTELPPPAARVRPANALAGPGGLLSDATIIEMDDVPLGARSRRRGWLTLGGTMKHPRRGGAGRFGSRTWLVAAVAAVVLLGGGLVAAYVLTSANDEVAAQQPPGQPTPSAPGRSSPGPEPTLGQGTTVAGRMPAPGGPATPAPPTRSAPTAAR